MSKKTVVEQTADEAIKEGKAVEEAAIKATVPQQVQGKRYERGRIYIKCTYNNTIITVTDDKGNVLAWATAGALAFSGPKKATPFAAQKVVATIAEKVKKSGPINIDVFVNGFGGGRDSAIRSLINQGFNILSISDVTPIPHNGPRRPKIRRV